MHYIIKLINQWDKLAIPVSLVKSPLMIAFEMITMYFATTLTWCIENKKGIGTIVAVSVGLAVLSGAVTLCSNKLKELYDNKRVQINRRFDLLLGEKILDMDFALIEGPTGRNKYQKAKNALGTEGAYGFIDHISQFFTCVIGIFSYGAITATLNPWLIVILTFAQLLAFSSAALESHLINKTKDPIAEIDRRLNYMTKTSRDFTIAKDIRIFRLRAYLQSLSEHYVGERKNWTAKMYLYYFISDSVSLVLNVGVEIGVFAYIAYKAFTGDLSKTALVFYSLTIVDFSHWVASIGEFLSDIIPSNMKIDDLREFLNLHNAEKQGGLPLPTERPYQIQIENVSFSYPETNRLILDNISLTINAGERLALVGVNGAGKTTLVKLLCGLYRPTAGKIKINGTDISEFDRDEYFTAVSAVFQEARVMPCSILENVSMLPEDVTNKEKAQSCLTEAGLFEKVQRLPEKENSLLVKNINENAVEMSGGETQRLLLARAIYKSAPILILDEPTAALDPIAENEVYLKYNSLSKNRTSVYISHRLSSTRFCDRIVLLSGAKIAESGTHDELMALNKEYAQMFSVQSKYYEDGGRENEPE